MKRQTLQALPIVIMLMICVWIAGAWTFARFVHYHAQRQILVPAHYTADVISAASSAPDTRDMADFRKSEDGQYFVRVATLGTAHHMDRTTSDLLPPFILALGGFVLSVLLQKRQNAEPDPQA